MVLPARLARGLVVARTRWTSCTAVYSGWSPTRSATTPATCGVAIEVPEKYAKPPGTVLRMFTPGEAVPVVTRRGERRREVGAVRVVVLDVPRVRDEVPAVDVAHVAVGARALVRVDPDPPGELGVEQVDAGVEHGDDRRRGPGSDT